MFKTSDNFHKSGHKKSDEKPQQIKIENMNKKQPEMQANRSWSNRYAKKIDENSKV